MGMCRVGRGSVVAASEMVGGGMCGVLFVRCVWC